MSHLNLKRDVKYKQPINMCYFNSKRDVKDQSI